MVSLVPTRETNYLSKTVLAVWEALEASPRAIFWFTIFMKIAKIEKNDFDQNWKKSISAKMQKADISPTWKIDFDQNRIFLIFTKIVKCRFLSKSPMDDFGENRHLYVQQSDPLSMNSRLKCFSREFNDTILTVSRSIIIEFTTKIFLVVNSMIRSWP